MPNTCRLRLRTAAQKKNPKKLTHKLEFMKYDPRVMKHVLFQETKLK
jgi:ribosomal protein L33